MRGDAVQNAHPILRMFQICEAMKWSHLPLPGGLYAQDPDLLDGFLIIFSERVKHDAAEQKKRDAEMNRGKGPKPTSRGSGSRRRR